MTKAFFGAGQIAEREIQSGNIPTVIFDNNPELHGQAFMKLPVLEPSRESLANIDQLLICSSSISEITEQCHELGMDRTKIVVSDYLGDFAKAHRLESYKFDGYISCGLPSQKSVLKGGGVFHVSERDDGTLEIEKIFEANTHGCVRYDNELVFSAQGYGIVILDLDSGQVKQVIQLESGLRPHGVQRNKDGYFVTCSLDDSVKHFNSDGSLVRTYRLSDKKISRKSAQHHCNDLWVTDHSIFVSMFSLSGCWKLGVFDGGVAEVDRVNGEITHVIHDLSMPHNVTLRDERLYVLDSFHGRILGHNQQCLGTLNGFARGLAFDSDYILIGESKNRNATKMLRGAHLASLDSRITIVDASAGICRSISLPKEISEIHAVTV